MSRELPILCAGDVVRNILSGRKTQDRRPVKHVRRDPHTGAEVFWYSTHAGIHCDSGSPDWTEHAPWRPDDVLYVRESWTIPGLMFGNPGVDPEKCDRALLRYRADGETVSVPWLAPEDKVRPTWRPSINMPKWAARIRLRVCSVSVERVHAIREEDAMAEGIRRIGGRYTNGDLTEHRDPVAAFAALWDRLYGAGSFHSGAWCWVTRFEMVRDPAVPPISSPTPPQQHRL